jgi:hypothetical protein
MIKINFQKYQNYLRYLYENKLLVDLLLVSFVLYISFSWIEWRSPYSVSTYFTPSILLYPVVILASIYNFFKTKIQPKKIFYYASILLIIDIYAGYLYYGNTMFGIAKGVFLSQSVFHVVLLLLVLSFLSILTTSENENIQKNNFRGKKTFFLLLLIFFVGFLIRTWDLGSLSPVRDEYSHLNAAKRLLSEGFFNYSRAQIITHSISWSWNLLNNGDHSLFLARLVSVIFGTISLPLCYFLCKSFGTRFFALITTLLLTFLPFHVGMSRYVREYVFYFLMLLVALYIIHMLFQSIIHKSKLKALLYLILFFPFLFYYFYDSNSTYPFIFVTFLIFSIVYLTNFCIQNRKAIMRCYLHLSQKQRSLYSFIFFFLSLTSGYYLIKRFVFGNLHFKLHAFEPGWFEIFLSTNSPQQWFFGAPYSSFFIFIILLFGIYQGLKKNSFVFSSGLTFFVMLIIYSFFLDISVAPRYIFPLALFATIIFGYSIESIYKALKPHKFSQNIIIILLLVTMFNPLTTISFISNEKDGEINKQQGLIHRETSKLLDFLDSNGFSNKDVIISPNKAIFIFYYGYEFVQDPDDWPYIAYKFKRDGTLFTDYGKIIQTKDRNKMIASIKEFDSGWLVIDKDRNRNWRNTFETEDTKIGDVFLQYLGDVGGRRGYDIYKW